MEVIRVRYNMGSAAHRWTVIPIPLKPNVDAKNDADCQPSCRLWSNGRRFALYHPQRTDYSRTPFRKRPLVLPATKPGGATYLYRRSSKAEDSPKVK